MSSDRERTGRALVRIQPRLLRKGDVIFRPLRRVKPVLRIKKAVILTRHTDVRAVLERDDVFSVTYGAHMEAVTGPFILGWDDGPRYQHEVGALRDATPHADLPRVAALTSARAAHVLSGGGTRDGVTLADDAVGAGLADYFGLPEVADPGMRAAARDVFRAVFLDAETPATVQRGKAASAELVAAIRTAMDRVRTTPDDTVVGRLVSAGALDDEAGADTEPVARLTDRPWWGQRGVPTVARVSARTHQVSEEPRTGLVGIQLHQPRRRLE